MEQTYSNDNNEVSTKFVNFITPGAGILLLGRSHITHYSEYAFTLSIISTLIAII